MPGECGILREVQAHPLSSVTTSSVPGQPAVVFSQSSPLASFIERSQLQDLLTSEEQRMKPLQYKVTHWTLDPSTQEERYEPLTDENGEILIFDTDRDARAQAMLLMERQGFDPYSTYFSDLFLAGHANPEAKRCAKFKTLHKTLYELVADFAKDTNCSPSETPITVLLEWCQRQTRP
jgi:hypothetical protein